MSLITVYLFGVLVALVVNTGIVWLRHKYKWDSVFNKVFFIVTGICSWVWVIYLFLITGMLYIYNKRMNTK